MVANEFLSPCVQHLIQIGSQLPYWDSNGHSPITGTAIAVDYDH